MNSSESDSRTHLLARLGLNSRDVWIFDDNETASEDTTTANTDCAEVIKDSEWLGLETTFIGVHRLFGLPVPAVWGDGEEPCPFIGLDGYKGGWITAEGGEYIYCLFHVPSEKMKTTYTLVEFYANQTTKGKLLHLDTAGERGTWLARMLADLGSIDLPKLDCRLLGDDWPEEAHRVYDGLVLLIRCHMRTEPTKPATGFAVDFGSSWCDVARGTFRKYRDQLRRQGHIEKIEETGRKAILYALTPDKL